MNHATTSSASHNEARKDGRLILNVNMRRAKFRRNADDCDSKRTSEDFHRPRVIFNVRGHRFETYESTLQRYPDTLLGNTSQRLKYYNTNSNEYVFDRDREAFNYILFYYQSNGILSRPLFVGEDDFNAELEFFGLIKKAEVEVKKENPREINKTKWKDRIWVFLEFPEKDRLSTVWAHIAFVVILASVATLCVETSFSKSQPTLYRKDSVWFALEVGFATWFTVEYLLRLISAPNKRKYLLTLLALIDVSAVLPFYITLIFIQWSSTVHSLAVIRVLRLFQIVRIAKLTRYSAGLQILGKSLLFCREQLMSLLTFFLIGTIFSSSLVYMFEVDVNETQFESIPATMWFVSISMTTVGYGDVVPISFWGKIAATCSILIGTIILFHLFIPVYLMYFTLLYDVKSSSETEQVAAKAPKNSVAGIEGDLAVLTASEVGEWYQGFVQATYNAGQTGVFTAIPLTWQGNNIEARSTDACSMLTESD